MILLKDYLTNKKSLTITVFILGILAMIAYIVIGLILMFKGLLKGPETTFGFLILGFLGFGGGLYYKKRVRLSTTGLEFEQDQNIKE